MTAFLANLQVTLFLSYLTVWILSVLMAWTGRYFAGSWLWVAGLGLITAGTGFDLIPPDGPVWLTLVVGNTAYTSAALFFSHAVWVFRFSRPFPRFIYGLIPLMVLSFLLALGQPYLVRALVFSGWMATGTLTVAALLLWKVEPYFALANGLTALPFLGLGISSAVRLVHLGFWGPRSDGSFFAEVNIWYVTGAILISTLILFGYHMMTGIRAEQLVTLKDTEIEARNRKLVESGRAKDLFFSIIAHDLRGPIGGSARYVRKHLLGKMTGLEAKYNEVETLASALEKTNEFLEKLLWWSRAQLQDWVPDLVPLDLARAFEQSHSLVKSAADLKEISIRWDPPPYPSPLADPESVQLILGNLLSNAVKFSLPGRSIRVRVGLEATLCTVTVEDEGVGMDETTLDRLFRIEDKLTTHGTTGERGSGLGLILARSLAERNNGGITIESEPGRGTKATLWLPTQTPGQLN